MPKSSWAAVDISNDLIVAKELVFDPLGFECTNLVAEKESSEYGAFSFQLDKLSIKFRTAKITPTKVGQFVVLWKRIGKGPIQPFDASDLDFAIISVRDKKRFGQFIFPKSALIKHGVLTAGKKEGKRAIRVYPPWDKVDSKQALKTQAWQLKFFLDVSSTNGAELRKSLLFK